MWRWWWWWRENNRNEEVEEENKNHLGGKIIKIVEEGIKKIEGRNKIEKGEG